MTKCNSHPHTTTTTPTSQSLTLRIFTSNVRGLVRNWDSIKLLDLNSYDILIFNEIWQIRDFENVNLPNFVTANIYQRVNQRGGGVIIYTRDNLQFDKIESPIEEGSIETTAIKLGNLIVAAIYRPPNGDKNLFVEKLTDWINRQHNRSIFIAGDFNINYLNRDIQYFDTIETLTGLTPSITEITRIESESCIDNVLTSTTGNHTVTSIKIADHFGLLSNLNNCKTSVTEGKTFKYRVMKETNWLQFSHEINRIVITGNSIDDKWKNLCQDIKSAIERSFPEKTSKKKYKFQMSQGLLKSKNKKNKLLRQYKRGIIPKEEHDSKKKWKVLKEELKINTEKETIDSIQVNGELITEKTLIAKKFKEHFETCAIKLANEVPNSGENEILIDQKPEWEFREITEAHLLKIINSLVPKSSCGFDLLSNRMLKKEKIKFSKLLIDLINETIKSNTFPEVLKTAKVIPIFKKGDKKNLNNYRPISLLPVLSKVLEKVINEQITEKLDQMHIIDDNQYGFRSGHSTEDAVIKFIDFIEKAKKENKHVISIHIDVSKAFDSCDHTIIRSKLSRIGLSGSSLDLMTSYLKDRIQEMWIEDECGGRFVINIGVGQGTVLGPTLFKIYILDMYLSTTLFSIRFADDTNLVGHGNDRLDTERNINSELKRLHDWFCKNKLTLHPDKSRYIIHTRDKLVNIKLGGRDLMRCGYGLQEEGVKFLGVIIDENLDWKLQVSYVKKKIGKGNYLLWRYKNRITIAMKKVIYESFIRSHLTYCLSVWGAKKTQSLTELKKSVKKSWTKIGKRKQHTNERLSEHKMLKLEDELEIAEIKLIWRWQTHKIPMGLRNLIEERNINNLRNRQFVRHRLWNQDSIAYRLATRAKKEIKEIEIARSKKGLVKKYKNKKWLVSYATNCRIRNCFICTQN